MSATVKVNERTVVHEASGGVSMAFPDTCKVPYVGPIPFLNLALSIDATNTSASVYADGKTVMLKDSHFGRSYGNDPGIDGGVISGTYNGKASFTNYSFDVLIEGRNVARLGDPMVHNHGSEGNAYSPAELQPNVNDPLFDVFAELCKIFCYCQDNGQTTKCCDEVLANEIWRNDDPGARHYYDPKRAGLYVEVPFDMSKKPPQPMMDKQFDGKSPDMRSRNPNLRDPDDPSLGMPLPGGDFPIIPNSRRPDVVHVKNPNLPIDAPGNIDAIFDFKFGGDAWGRGQFDAYEKIARAGNVYAIKNETCACPGGRRRFYDDDEYKKKLDDEKRKKDEEEKKKKDDDTKKNDDKKRPEKKLRIPNILGPHWNDLPEHVEDQPGEEIGEGDDVPDVVTTAMVVVAAFLLAIADAPFILFPAPALIPVSPGPTSPEPT